MHLANFAQYLYIVFVNCKKYVHVFVIGKYIIDICIGVTAQLVAYKTVSPEV